MVWDSWASTRVCPTRPVPSVPSPRIGRAGASHRLRTPTRRRAGTAHGARRVRGVLLTAGRRSIAPWSWKNSSRVTTASWAPRLGAALTWARTITGLHVIGISQFPAQVDRTSWQCDADPYRGAAHKRHRVAVADEMDIDPAEIARAGAARIHRARFQRATARAARGRVELPGGRHRQERRAAPVPSTLPAMPRSPSVPAEHRHRHRKTPLGIGTVELDLAAASPLPLAPSRAAFFARTSHTTRGQHDMSESTRIALKVAGIALITYAAVAWFQSSVGAIPYVGAYLPKGN